MSYSLDIIQLNDDLFRLVETDDSGKFVDSYLLEGEEKSLLIDTQRCRGNLFSTVQMLTDKPLQVVITHSHYDHFGPSTEEFLRADIPVWIFHDEYNAVAPYGREAIPVCCNEDYGLHWLQEGQVFDLGGIKLQVSSLAGHTPCAAMLFEQEKKWLFSGDALGNRSFWMQVDSATSLEKFAVQYQIFLDKLDSISNLKIFTGHGIGKSFFSVDWAKSVLYTTQQVIDGSLSGYPIESRWPDTFCLDTPAFPEGFYYNNKRIYES